MWRGTLALAFKLGVSLSDGALVLAVGMPDLETEEFSAVLALQLCRKRSAAVMAPPHIFPAFHALLNPI